MESSLATSVCSGCPLIHYFIALSQLNYFNCILVALPSDMRIQYSFSAYTCACYPAQVSSLQSLEKEATNFYTRYRKIAQRDPDSRAVTVFSWGNQFLKRKKKKIPEEPFIFMLCNCGDRV